MQGKEIFEVLLSIVIGLALVGTVATSTSTGSTALAGFSSAQALVIIVPLIFVAIILYGAYGHVKTKQFNGIPALRAWVLRAFNRAAERVMNVVFRALFSLRYLR